MVMIMLRLKVIQAVVRNLEGQSQKWESFVDGSDGNCANNDDDSWDQNDDGAVLGGDLGDGDDHVEGDEGGGEEIGRSISEGKEGLMGWKLQQQPDLDGIHINFAVFSFSNNNF